MEFLPGELLRDNPSTLILYGINNLLTYKWPEDKRKYTNSINIIITLFVVVYFIATVWMPLGVQNSFLANLMFVAITVGLILSALMMIVKYYTQLLTWSLTIIN